MTATLTAGFADPPIQAQGVFRLVLDAMARPGRIQTLADDAPPAPAPLDDATFALALTLLDFETPVWLDESLTVPSVVESLRFHCGCSIVQPSDGASFALIGDGLAMPPFSAFAKGSPEYPDRAATLVIQTDGLADDGGWTLHGPGIEIQARLRVLGVPEDMARSLQMNRGDFPNGVDLIFTHGRRLACLPRTTSLEV